MDAAVISEGALSIPPSFEVSSASIRRNLRGPWVVDDDPFQINQFGHPYQGAMYHGIARSNGLGYWPSVAYTFAGSALWEIAGEATPPSRNDQIASGIAGLVPWRAAVSHLPPSPGTRRRGTRDMEKIGSVLASPPTGINHPWSALLRDRFRPDAVPFSDIRVQIGATAIRDRPGPRGVFAGVGSTARRVVDGLRASGKRQLPPRASVRLLQGRKQPLVRRSRTAVDARSDCRGRLRSGSLAGIWGLYGTYDYFAPDDFRFSSTAFSSARRCKRRCPSRWWCKVPGSWAAATLRRMPSTRRTATTHYGVAPQALANLRVIAGRRAALDVTAREYFVSRRAGSPPAGVI